MNEQSPNKKHVVRALIAAIVVTTLVTVAAITAPYSGGGSAVPMFLVRNMCHHNKATA